MRDSFFKMFGSVRLVQEVTRSNQSNTTLVDSESAHLVDDPLHLTNTTTTETTTTNTPNTTPTTINTISNTFTENKNSNDMLKDGNQDIEIYRKSSSAIQDIQTNHIYIQQQDIHQQPSATISQKSHCSGTQPIPITFNTFTASPNLLSSYKPADIGNLFLTSPTSTTKSHPRKNSKYTVRHHRTRQSSFNKDTIVRKPEQEEEEKSKSQKLLCLWPLPTVTRHMILIALFISTLKWLNILDLSCSAPSYVIHRLDIKNLILSPFLFDWTVPSMALFGWNVLILGLFEESLSHMVGGTRRFIELLVFLFVCVSSLRLLLGFVFSRSTGYAFPSLFFSNSMHECSQGLSPFLFALLVVQSLSIEDKYILIYGQEESNHKITVRKVTLQLLMCLVNYTTKNILWWSVSGLVTGLLTTIALQTALAREKREDSSQVKDVNEFITLERYRRTPLWRLIWFAFKNSVMIVGVTLPILMVWNSYYSRESMVTSAELNTVSQDRYLFTFVFMTAPRRGDPAYLTRTIDSYLSCWPEYPSADSPYSRIQAIIYTHFSNHTQYDLAKAHFSKTTKGQRYLRWVREEGEELNQRLHVSKALDFAADTYPSTYYALMEDDFPVCGVRQWHEIENVIYKAEKSVPNHCGVFVGTGGSGLFLKPELARMASQLLLKYVDMPPDIIIQKCLMGQLPECAACTDSLVTSKTLLMYHIGYNMSTSEDRIYKKDEFQCGWRHPFNGDPSVVTL